MLCWTQSHRFTYNEPMPVESCTQSLCDLALRFGEDSDDAGGMVRNVKGGEVCRKNGSCHDSRMLNKSTRACSMLVKSWLLVTHRIWPRCPAETIAGSRQYSPADVSSRTLFGLGYCICSPWMSVRFHNCSGVMDTTITTSRFLASQSRPFGVALLIAGWDEAGPVL
jgi:hypothetical protein